MLLLLITNLRDVKFMSKKDNEKTKEYLWDDQEIEETRKTLLSYYTSLQGSQSTRLIGFVAGLFTLLQLAQVAKTSAFGLIFPNINFGLYLPPFWMEFLKFLPLYAGTVIILFFMFRAIFRFCLFGHYSSAIISLDKTDFQSVMEEHPEEKKMRRPVFIGNLAASIKLIKENRRAYIFFRSIWFLKFKTSKYEAPSYKGALVLTGLSVSIAFLILFILW